MTIGWYDWCGWCSLAWLGIYSFSAIFIFCRFSPAKNHRYQKSMIWRPAIHQGHVTCWPIKNTILRSEINLALMPYNAWGHLLFRLKHIWRLKLHSKQHGINYGRLNHSYYARGILKLHRQTLKSRGTPKSFLLTPYVIFQAVSVMLWPRQCPQLHSLCC